MGSPESAKTDAAIPIYCSCAIVDLIYRLLDPAKAEIQRKSMELTKEIRSYNSIVKYDDVCKDAEQAKPSSVSVEQVEQEPVASEEREKPCEQPALSCKSSNGQPDAEEAKPKSDTETETETQPLLSAADEPEGDAAAATSATQLDFDVRGFKILFYCFQNIILRTCLKLQTVCNR